MPYPTANLRLGFTGISTNQLTQLVELLFNEVLMKLFLLAYRPQAQLEVTTSGYQLAY